MSHRMPPIQAPTVRFNALPADQVMTVKMDKYQIAAALRRFQRMGLHVLRTLLADLDSPSMVRAMKRAHIPANEAAIVIATQREVYLKHIAALESDPATYQAAFWRVQRKRQNSTDAA